MPRYEIRFPPTPSMLDQDKEFCEVRFGEEWRRIRFHDYDQVYREPGLYEQLFYGRLGCTSHTRIASMFLDVIRERSESPAEMRVLEVGAGNGVVAEEFRKLGVPQVYGIDIIPEARQAAERDRPGVYDRYFVADLTSLSENEQFELRKLRPNVLLTVAALGFGDIPPLAFENAFNFVAPGGWLCFNAKLNFLSASDESGFASLVRRMIQTGIIEIESYRVYCHRLSVRGERLYYAALVARKRADIPGAGLKELRGIQASVLPLPSPAKG